MNKAKALLSGECLDFLTKKLGVTAKQLKDNLGKMKGFDALTSTNSIADAGLWPYGEPESDQMVKDHFSDPDEHLAATAIPGGERTRYHTYFGAKGIDAAAILYESLSRIRDISCRPMSYHGEASYCHNA